MIPISHVKVSARRALRREAACEPSLRSVILGTSAFVLAAAACLYLVAQLGS